MCSCSTVMKAWKHSDEKFCLFSMLLSEQVCIIFLEVEKSGILFCEQRWCLRHLSFLCVSGVQAENKRATPQVSYGSLVHKIKVIHAGPEGIVEPWQQQLHIARIVYVVLLCSKMFF